MSLKKNPFILLKLTIPQILETFSTIEPTLFNVCEFWFNKDQSRLQDLRIDSLSQILNLANIRPGGGYLAVDDVSGMLVAGMLDRFAILFDNWQTSLGQGRLSDSDSPPAYPVLP